MSILATQWSWIQDAAKYILSNPAFPLVKEEGSPPYSIGLLDSVWTSLFRVLMGTVVGFSSGVVCGLLLSQLSYLGPRLHAFILFLAPLAPLVWLPLLVATLGTGNLTIVAIVAAASVFLSTIVVYYLATHPKTTYIDLVRLMGASRWETLRHVIIPSLLPTLLLLFRISLFGGWMALLAAEMAGADVGLGAMLIMGRSLGNFSIVLLATVLIAILAFALDQIVSLIATRVVTKRYGAWFFLGDA